VDYFYRASLLKRETNAPFPFRTYQNSSCTVYHLTRDPSFKRSTVDKVAELYHLSDLRPALADYLDRLLSDSNPPQLHIDTIGGRRRALENCRLPFIYLEVWKKLRLQSTAYHYPHSLLPPVTINATPPDHDWQFGHFDSAIVNLDPSEKWPKSGLKGARFLFFKCRSNITNMTDNSFGRAPGC
jgi:hypothetical protein